MLRNKTLSGRVIRVDKESCLVQPDSNLEIVMLETDAVRWKGKALAVGDFVEFEYGGDESVKVDIFRLTQLKARKTALFRRDPKKPSSKQVIAANIDLVGIVCGLDQKLSVAGIERALVLIAESGAEALIILSKADLLDKEKIELCLKELAPLGQQVLVCSIVSGRSLLELKNMLVGKALILIGASGAGKSSLVNALLEKEQQPTKEVRAKDGKGRHTTVVRELISLSNGGAIIDSPGIRAIGLPNDSLVGNEWAGSKKPKKLNNKKSGTSKKPGTSKKSGTRSNFLNALNQVFFEITRVASECKFNDCAHNKEPECAVKASVELGEINKERLKRYQQLLAELNEIN